MPHIFISYAKKDTRQLAENLYQALNAVPGLTAWMDMSLEADSSWAQQIQNEIDCCDYFIVLLSPDVNRRETDTQARSFVLNEIDYAQQDRKPILPVMAIRTRQPVQIAGIQYVDLTHAPTNPTPIVERICKRFNVETPEQIREREARERESRLAAEQEALEREAERSQQMAIEARERESRLVEEQDAKRSENKNSPVDGGQPGEAPLHSTGTNSFANPQHAQPPTRVEFQPQADSSPIPGQSAVYNRRWLWVGAMLIPIALFIGLGVWNMLPHAVTRNTDWTPVTQEFDGVTMVQVPAGCFNMGSEDISDDERPVNQQCFDGPFWIDRTEVTQADFERLNGQKANPNAFDGDQRPVESITWLEARDFCALRGMRLPTEREWEYAARGPDNLIYPWGNEGSSANAVWRDNSNGQTAPVGSRSAGVSWVGALDMSGNVWEWVSSLHQSYPYVGSDGREDLDDRTDFRVLRGGSWGVNITDLLGAAIRFRVNPAFGNSDFGFRCARSA